MDLLVENYVSLLAPRMDAGRPLMVALGKRHSTREFGERDVSMQTLADLLWAAYGINREETGGRTAPSAKNWQEIEVYVATAEGLWLYEAGKHALKQVLANDIRAATGMQDFVARAPINLVYVADLSKVDALDSIERRFYCAANAGAIVQNVYLFCASEGLATVVRGLVNRRELARTMRLESCQRVLLAQTVGYAADG